MRNNFEGAAIERLDAEKLFTQARKYSDEHRVKEGEFKDIYPDEWHDDLTKASGLDDKFSANDSKEDSEQKKVADAFEAIILKFGETFEWFGSNAMTLKTSKFDDYTNGVDIVAEFSEEDRLAIDVTYSANAIKKFEKILSHIKDGDLGEVKYFISQIGDTKGKIEGIPEVVIGASRKTVTDLSNLWSNERYSKDKIASHYVQIMILKQIREQLDVFSLYAIKSNKPNLVERYTQLLGIIDSILKDKVSIERLAGPEIGEDTVNSDIMTYLKDLKKSLLTQVETA